MANSLTLNFTDEQLAVQQIFEAQITYTAEMITGLVGGHPHYTDDCGDYLTGALELSLRMAEARMEGIDEFLLWMKQLQATGKFHSGNDWLVVEDIASDGISPAVYDFLGLDEEE